MNAAVEPPSIEGVAAARERCYHCAEALEPSSRHEIVFDGERRALCCIGCEAVMRAILDAGLADYYRRRTAPAAFGVVPEDIAAALDELAVYDEPEFVARHVTRVGADELARERFDERSTAARCPVSSAARIGGGESAALGEVLLSIEGLRCGACVWLLERSLCALPGVVQASCNYSTARARVRFDTDRLPLSAVLARVREVGYRARPCDTREREAAVARESRQWLQRLFVAGIAAMQVMMYALPAYLAGPDGIEPEYEQLLRWASLVLTTPVMLYSAQPFLVGAWRSLRALRPNMDVPVSIGLLAAFGASVHATLTLRGEIWFDSVAMFAFLLLGARWLEWQARRRALRALDDLGGTLPEIATRLESPGGVPEERRVPAVRLEPGDRVRVASGERVPADARVAEGVRGAVDLSLLSGESAPLVVAGGESVPGGALVVDTPLELIVERGVAASAPSMIERLIERGAAEKPRIVRLADRIAVVFVTLLLAFAALVFALWWTFEPSRAVSVALSVLVVSCPCALSLATPAALAAATGRLLDERLVVTRGHAIETAARVTDVVLDKTGTLTTGRPVLASFARAEGIGRVSALALAAALERGSSHPFARAIREAAVAQSTAGGGGQFPVQPCESVHEAGHGVRAVLDDGRVLRLGSAAWCGLTPELAARWRDGSCAGVSFDGDEEGEEAGKETLGEGSLTSEVFLVEERAGRGASARRNRQAECEAVPLARFGFVDPPRPEAEGVIASLREHGLDVHLLSGDRPDVVERVADELGIDSRRGGATPADKQAVVAALQAAGRRVLMVGDGINDAPVLALADVSLAVGDSTALTRTAADTISLAPGIAALPSLLEQTRRAARVVRQNLAWAASYNLLAIPAAAFGLVPPWAAAVGMAASSLLVVCNALRLVTSR